MKFFIIILFIIFQSCSFDNKSGIWTNENDKISDQNQKDDFIVLSATSNIFNKTIPKQNNFNFKIFNTYKNNNWNDIFFNKNNNLINLKYNNSNKLIFKSKKITRQNLSSHVLYQNNNLITHDYKGNILVYSIEENKIIDKFNFYKNRYKKFKKTLNLIVENNIIFVTDSLGYVYAYDFLKKEILWAKNYKIPFRSNLKIIKNKLAAANQSNTLYFLNKFNGEIIKLIPTEETPIKNKFINNLASFENNTFFLNTYGSLYSIQNDSSRVTWFINLNETLDTSLNNLFFGSQIVINNDLIAITSKKFLYLINKNNGSVIYKKNFSSFIRPLIIENNLFIITENNLLVAVDIKKKEIIYSYDINEKISKYLNIKKKTVDFKDILIANNQIFIFLKNSYLLKFSLDGELEKVNKLPSKMISKPIIVNGALVYLDKNNKIFIID
ncbi:MAG: PQQ-binding-like beta-propeller repeat protein [Pseudomonadota bacterium]|nr:PQQ-binding-like beta-propeller repeat protein [Pseudomonadota bacterium]